MKLVGAGHEGRPEQCQGCAKQEAGTQQASAKRAQPAQAHGAIAHEVSCLANPMVQDLPPCVPDASEEVLPHPTQRAAGVIGAEQGC